MVMLVPTKPAFSAPNRSLFPHLEGWQTLKSQARGHGETRRQTKAKTKAKVALSLDKTTADKPFYSENAEKRLGVFRNYN
jgi:hypothetical protein